MDFQTIELGKLYTITGFGKRKSSGILSSHVIQLPIAGTKSYICLNNNETIVGMVIKKDTRPNKKKDEKEWFIHISVGDKVIEIKETWLSCNFVLGKIIQV